MSVAAKLCAARPDGAAGPDGPAIASALDGYRLVASSLGLQVPALLALKKVGWIDHFYHLTAPLERLRYLRLRTDLAFSEATQADFAEIVRGLGELELAARKEVVARVLFQRRARRGCWIGRDEQGELVSMQWLFRPADDAALQERFPRRYHPLHADEVLIENVFVFPRFRAAGVFPTVNHAVLDLARREGFRSCAAYIRKDNVASLNAYLDLGFRIRKLLTGYTLAGVSWRTL
jgi:RimJ/RimL family protein N-acetyltransferase